MVRKLLIGLVALQLLNISLCCPDVSCSDYDYSYTWNNTYDPTESALEWIVEMQYGQQKGFSFSNHSDHGKNLLKTFHWQSLAYETTVRTPPPTAAKNCYPEIHGDALPSRSLDILAPPPRG